jgi:hypothetical protein
LAAGVRSGVGLAVDIPVRFVLNKAKRFVCHGQAVPVRQFEI